MSSERYSSHVAVFIIVFNEQGEILLQQRANTGFLDGYWDFPSGHVEHGESLLDAAVRELEEEVCLKTSAGNLKLVHIAQNFLDIAYTNFFFVTQTWSGTPAVGEPDKVSGVKFVAPDQLPERSSLGVRFIEKSNFSSELGYSVVTPENFKSYMGQPFDSENWGKK